jgi:hypothetical protein
VQTNPKDFYAWHNYGDLNYSAGDLWMMNVIRTPSVR